MNKSLIALTLSCLGSLNSFSQGARVTGQGNVTIAPVFDVSAISNLVWSIVQSNKNTTIITGAVGTANFNDYKYLGVVPVSLGQGFSVPGFGYKVSIDSTNWKTVTLSNDFANGTNPYTTGGTNPIYAPTICKWKDKYIMTFDTYALKNYTGDSTNSFNLTTSTNLVDWTPWANKSFYPTIPRGAHFAGSFFSNVVDGLEYYMFTMFPTNAGGPFTRTYITWFTDDTGTNFATPIQFVTNHIVYDGSMIYRQGVYWLFGSDSSYHMNVYTNTTGPTNTFYVYATNITAGKMGAFSNIEGTQVLEYDTNKYVLYLTPNPSGSQKQWYSLSTNLSTWGPFYPIIEDGDTPGRMYVLLLDTGTERKIAQGLDFNQASKSKSFTFTYFLRTGNTNLSTRVGLNHSTNGPATPFGARTIGNITYDITAFAGVDNDDNPIGISFAHFNFSQLVYMDDNGIPVSSYPIGSTKYNWISRYETGFVAQVVYSNIVNYPPGSDRFRTNAFVRGPILQVTSPTNYDIVIWKVTQTIDILTPNEPVNISFEAGTNPISEPIINSNQVIYKNGVVDTNYIYVAGGDLPCVQGFYHLAGLTNISGVAKPHWTNQFCAIVWDPFSDIMFNNWTILYRTNLATYIDNTNSSARAQPSIGTADIGLNWSELYAGGSTFLPTALRSGLFAGVGSTAVYLTYGLFNYSYIGGTFIGDGSGLTNLTFPFIPINALNGRATNLNADGGFESHGPSSMYFMQNATSHVHQIDTLVSGTNGPTITSGSGSPEGVVSAKISSLYLRTNGGAGTVLYMKELNNGGNTGWTNVIDTAGSSSSGTVTNITGPSEFIWTAGAGSGTFTATRPGYFFTNGMSIEIGTSNTFSAKDTSGSLEVLATNSIVLKDVQWHRQDSSTLIAAVINDLTIPRDIQVQNVQASGSIGIRGSLYMNTNTTAALAIDSNNDHWVRGVTVTNNISYKTNSNGMIPDFNKAYTLVTTNAAFTILAPVNVDSTKTLDQTTVFMVTNSTAAAVLITAPANVHTQGTWYVTNLTTITFFCHAGTGFTNAISLPLW